MAAPELSALLSPLYAAAIALRGRLYEAGLLQARRLEVPVVSVGNLTVGGTGKSPLVALAARILAERGLRPAVVSRGYRGGHAGPSTVVSAGDGPLVGADLGGDEPVMLARQLRGVPILVARRRHEGGRRAVAEFGAGCVILDDGFQHRSLARDLDLLLLDGADPFGNGRLLPGGPLREPARAMSRAHALVITRSDRSGDAAREALSQAAERHCPRVPVFHARARAAALLDVEGRASLPPERLRGARVACFAGIARPERFFRDLASLGATVAAALPFPDHHRYTSGDLLAIREAAARTGADLLVTTEKDLARAELPGLPRLHALAMETTVDEAAAFATLLEAAVS